MKNKLKVIALLSILATVTIHIINRVVYTATTINDLLNKKDNQYYEWLFGKVRYTKKGNGNPLLLIHDLAPGSSSYEFSRISSELAKTNEVYILDLPGYGLSDKQNITYTNFLYVELVTDFIKNVIGKKTDVITSGDSSSIAVMACHNNPEIINKLIFINPQSISSLIQIPSRRTRILKLIIQTPVIGTFIFNILTGWGHTTKKFRREYFFNPSMIHENDVACYREAAHTGGYCSKYSFASQVGRYMNINILHARMEIDYSMYIIAGAEISNVETIVDNYIYYNNAIEHVYIKNTKKLPHMERPDKVLDQIRTFIG